jgi:hypothetical protein
METRNATTRKFISDEITRALLRAGLSYDHPIGEDLDARAEIAGVRDALVRVRDERNQTLKLEDRIVQLRHDPRFAASFPLDPPKIARSDMRKLAETFDAIAAGKVGVE